MIVADFSMIPMGEGPSASRYVRAIHQVLKESGLNFVPGPMSTALEAESMEEIFDIIKDANKALAQLGVQRIVTSLKIDYRTDKDISIDTKMSAIR